MPIHQMQQWGKHHLSSEPAIMSCDFYTNSHILKCSVLLPNPNDSVLVASYHLATYPPFCNWIGCCSCICTSSKCSSAQIISKLLLLVQKLKNYCQCLKHYYLPTVSTHKYYFWEYLVRNALAETMASLCLLVSYGVFVHLTAITINVYQWYS